MEAQIASIPNIETVIKDVVKKEGRQSMKFRCHVCQKPTLQKCDGCHEAFYCCAEHQKSHWPIHKASCLNSRMGSKGKALVYKKGNPANLTSKTRQDEHREDQAL